MDSTCPKCKTVISKRPGFEWLDSVNPIDLGETLNCPLCRTLIEINGDYLELHNEEFQDFFFFNIVDKEI